MDVRQVDAGLLGIWKEKREGLPLLFITGEEIGTDLVVFTNN